MQIKIRKKSLLLDALLELSPNSSKTTLRSWLKDGRVLVDGKSAHRHDLMLDAGAQVSLKRRIKYMPLDIKILFEDRDLIVINKPEGVLSVSTVYEEAQTAHCILKKRFFKQRVYPVHRLDRETSGVMVFATSEKARVSLKKQFHDHSILREYRAIIEGCLSEDKGTWESFLKENASYEVYSADSGAKAVTHYEVIKKMPHTTHIKLTLETGKKNQIRVHCTESGHPICGDEKYGSTMNPFKRVALHAYQLGFVHPRTGKKMTFVSDLPPCFQN